MPAGRACCPLASHEQLCRYNVCLCLSCIHQSSSWKSKGDMAEGLMQAVMRCAVRREAPVVRNLEGGSSFVKGGHLVCCCIWDAYHVLHATNGAPLCSSSNDAISSNHSMPTSRLFKPHVNPICFADLPSNNSNRNEIAASHNWVAMIVTVSFEAVFPYCTLQFVA